MPSSIEGLWLMRLVACIRLTFHTSPSWRLLRLRILQPMITKKECYNTYTVTSSKNMCGLYAPVVFSTEAQLSVVKSIYETLYTFIKYACACVICLILDVADDTKDNIYSLFASNQRKSLAAIHVLTNFESSVILNGWPDPPKFRISSPCFSPFKDGERDVIYLTTHSTTMVI